MDFRTSKAQTQEVDAGIMLAYRLLLPPSEIPPKGTILLIHGFPQTSYQFRHVAGPFSSAGYRVLLPDYRGAGGSSKAASGYTKSRMAADMATLVAKLQPDEKVHVVGHDIGGMIAFAMAQRFPELVRSVCWGECPLPGTKAYNRDRTEHAVQQFHFIFHCVRDLPEALVEGRERLYIDHFLKKIVHKEDAITEADLDLYAKAFEQPGAMGCGFELYRAFEEDVYENQSLTRNAGKCRVPTMVLSGDFSRHRNDAAEMAAEVHEDGTWEEDTVPDAAHYIAEENPNRFVDTVLKFINKHPSD